MNLLNLTSQQIFVSDPDIQVWEKKMQIELNKYLEHCYETGANICQSTQVQLQGIVKKS